MEPDLSRQRTRRYVVRAAEGREEIVNSILVGDVNAREGETPLIAFALEEVIIAHRNVEQMPWSNARRIVVVILGSGGRYLEKRRPVLIRWAQIRAQTGT